MDSAEILVLPGTACDQQPLESTSVRRLVMELYDREHLAVRRYLVFLGLNSETAQEIVQDAFLKLQEHLLADGDRRNLRAWLYRVGHNLARNAQTAARVTKTEALGPGEAVREIAASAASVEEELLEAERNARMQDAMNALSPAQKQCLILRAQGLKYREIAEALNISVSTVGENVQRGLEKLKEMV